MFLSGGKDSVICAFTSIFHNSQKSWATWLDQKDLKWKRKQNRGFTVQNNLCNFKNMHKYPDRFQRYSSMHLHTHTEEDWERGKLNTLGWRWEGKTNMIKDKKCLQTHRTKICHTVNSILCPWGPKINKIRSREVAPKYGKTSILKMKPRQHQTAAQGRAFGTGLLGLTPSSVRESYFQLRASVASSVKDRW